MYFACFCVFFYRSEVTKPTSSMCFCVFLFINFFFGHKPDRGKHLLQTVTTTQCVLCVFVFFPQRSQVTPPMCSVFFFNNIYFDPSSERGTHPTCFKCFCVFHHRSQGKQPMCFVCFCVFLLMLSLILVQTGASTQYFMYFCVLSQGLRSHNPCVPCVFVFFYQRLV